MYAIQLVEPSLTAFRRTSLPDPQPAAGDVVIRLRAAALNYIDVAVATGDFPGATLPIVPVADGAGDIVALGAGVTNVALGDRVIPHFMPDWLDGPMRPERIAAMRGITLPGSLSEYVAVPARSVVRLPDHLDFVQGAALPIAATTAWNAVRSASVRPGSTVVILGTGGVSLFALQFAKASGATVILVSSSDAKLERGRALGADHLVNYRATPAWDRVVLETTNGRGADLVVETVGDATFERSLNAAAMGGTVFTVGFLSGATTSVNLFSIIGKALRVVGNSTGSVADLAEAVRAVEANRIVPVVERTIGIDEVAGAYEMLASGAHIGKIGIAHL
ncbi:alcohol dehydrogenase [Massilia sp. Root133]|uniref:zinc-dependent alcohol dehydrogenase family protein n=1 Tax=unclassified Massilia TaxID=2609279 RepID=UPI0006FBA35E|nr:MULTISPECIES: NAD(P)-dependent alcohol dehydrogenase [unclassified Massilia]KQY10554.1 alcohol dehydrogenase [Massilia sp. Root133]KQZ47516.1 alcohol dehydrogenase [Massilia sp. Root1485]